MDSFDTEEMAGEGGIGERSLSILPSLMLRGGWLESENSREAFCTTSFDRDKLVERARDPD